MLRETAYTQTCWFLGLRLSEACHVNMVQPISLLLCRGQCTVLLCNCCISGKRLSLNFVSLESYARISKLYSMQ